MYRLHYIDTLKIEQRRKYGSDVRYDKKNILQWCDEGCEYHRSMIYTTCDREF